jgi:hypothetical protein
MPYRAEEARPRRCSNQLNEISKVKYVPAWSRAIIYGGLGQKDKAFAAVGRPAAAHESAAVPHGVHAKADPSAFGPPDDA